MLFSKKSCSNFRGLSIAWAELFGRLQTNVTQKTFRGKRTSVFREAASAVLYSFLEEPMAFGVSLEHRYRWRFLTVRSIRVGRTIKGQTIELLFSPQCDSSRLQEWIVSWAWQGRPSQIYLFLVI